jgi:uncharacterized protein (DUF1499 family)
MYHAAMYTRHLARSLTAALLILFLSATNSMSTSAPSTLPDCPDKPNCVSSQARDPAHHVEPFTYTEGSTAKTMQRLRSALATEPRIHVVAATPTYLHAEARSLIFRFVDDIEFLIDPGQRRIQVRSASRIGYSDFGVNRRRVERIRQAFVRAR